MDDIENIKEIEIEYPKINNKSNLKITEVPKPIQEQPKLNMPIDQEDNKKKEWEAFLKRKILTEEEHKKLLKQAKLFKILKYILIIILAIIIISILIWFISEFKKKDFSNNIFINNTNPIEVSTPTVNANVQVNQTNNQTFQLNATININIEKVIVNGTG